jgi:hypothetical protein
MYKQGKPVETEAGMEAYMRACGRSKTRPYRANRTDRVVPLEIFVALLRKAEPMTLQEMYDAIGRSSGYRSYEAIHVLEEYGLIERVGKRLDPTRGKESTLFGVKIGNAGDPLERRKLA